jgi:hypothetical protein
VLCRTHVIQVKSHIQQEDPTVSKAAKKILKSLDNHWHGLIPFVTDPKIPMDNNRGERILRGPSGLSKRILWVRKYLVSTIGRDGF